MNEHLFSLTMLLLFVAVFVACEGIYLWWNSTRGPGVARLNKRLRMISAGGHASPADMSVLKRRLPGNGAALDRFVSQIPRSRNLDRFLVQSGTELTVTNYLWLSTGLSLLAFLVLMLIRQPLVVALIIAAGLGLAPTVYLSYCRNLRTKKFETLLPEALDLIGRALRAGHSLPSALQMAGAELPAPVGEEFQQTFDEINFGISVPAALHNLSSRVPSTDLGYFVIAVLIQRETGGNLSEILSNSSAIIRERLKLFGKVQALSAEGRFSALVLTLLPFGVGALLYLIDAGFMATLWRDPTGLRMIYGALFLMLIGVLWMRLIIRIRV